jgi:hypothetical protein
VIQIRRVDHHPAAVGTLISQINQLEPDAAEVRVVIETRHGLLVEALLDAGFTVVPVNPDLIARRRCPARKKDDAEDARIAACWPWTATPRSSPCSRMGNWPPSCARSPATTSAPPATKPACSTGCAPTWRRPSRPR